MGSTPNVPTKRRRLLTITAAVLIGLSMMAAEKPKCEADRPNAGTGQPAPHHDPKPFNHTTSPKPKPKRYHFVIQGVMRPQRSTYWTYRCGDAEPKDELEIRVEGWKVECYAKPGDIIRAKIVSPRAGYIYCSIFLLDDANEKLYVKDQASTLKPGQCVVAYGPVKVNEP